MTPTRRSFSSAARRRRRYFQDLDQFCDEVFADRSEEERVKLAYGYVTWLVERRALEVYGTYKKALGDSEIARKLGGLLAEETKHLADVEALLQVADPAFPARSKELEAIETSSTKSSSPL